MQHDAKLDIATGRSRKETNWKNKTILWSAVVAKLSATHRTPETIAEYMAAKKPRQDEIKDIGGFVGGHLTGGRRKAGSVLSRQIVTLDADFNPSALWDDWLLLYGAAACVYSTHKHTKESPRLRLVIPLSRPVEPVEYMAIARRIAGTLGIDQFDPTTYQVERLMYWPSTSKDGDYFFDSIDAPWLDADALLATYHDYRDSSEWPASDKEGEVVTRAIKKQGDPLEKQGLVGTFCRTYTIHEAIDTFLGDIYTPTDVGDRYSYTLGSTAGGLITYDDKFAYSHHGTDPISGKLCNAFDLVRIHKFGLQDEDTDLKTSAVKMPSFKAMADFAAGLPEVRQTIGTEKLAEAKIDFADAEDSEGAPVEEPKEDWLKTLAADTKTGGYKSTIENVEIILENDPNLKKRFRYNDFSGRKTIFGKLPWEPTTPGGRVHRDVDESFLFAYLEKVYGISNRQNVRDALENEFYRNSFHPVREYLTGLKWDGEERIDTLFIDYLGTDDTEYSRTVSRKAMVAAVARVFEPGCKFDYVLTLVGQQGIGKSRLIKKLGGAWFSDTLTTLHGKEAFEQIQGFWLIELAELAGLRKAEFEIVKLFISKQEDAFRPAYGRNTVIKPRQCVFFGSTNDYDFLRDPTGNRRFWPLQTNKDAAVKDVSDISEEDIRQIWAEAVHLYREGETLYLPPELEELAKEAQGQHTETDDRAGAIENYLNTLLPANWDDMGIYERRAFLQDDDLNASGTVQRDKVCVAEIYCELFHGTAKDMTNNNTKPIHIILKRLSGWQEDGSARFKNYGYQRKYMRIGVFQKTETRNTKPIRVSGSVFQDKNL